MKTNLVKQALRQGGVSVGTFVFEFSTTGIARIAAEAGAEFIVFDMEHTGWSFDTIRMLLATACSADVAPIVRIPATEYHFVARTLDLGAMGVMVPMVETPQQAEQLVRFAKYPPRGRRGAAFGIAHDDYRGGDIRETIRTSNEEQLLIAQIETKLGLENVESIAAVDGIDVLWIGHFDLTNSLGIPGEFDHPQFLDAVRRVVEACARHDKTPGFMACDVDNGKWLIRQGFRAIAYGGDLWLYQTALRDGIASLGLK